VFLDPLLLTLLLLISALFFFVLVFLPPIIEILKPKDKGPRRMLKTPLQKIMRSSSKLAPTSKPRSVDNPKAPKDLQDFLEKVGLKICRVGEDTIRIFGDAAFPPNLEVSDNIVVEGALTVGDSCVFHGSVKAKGDVSVGNAVVVRGNLVSNKNVNIQDDAVIGGSVHAEGSVRLGEKVYVGLSVVADGDVELFENSEVKKNILTNGVIKVLKNPILDFPLSIKDIG